MKTDSIHCAEPNVCAQMFHRFDEKLDEMHAEMILVRQENTRLNLKLSNGIMTDIATLKERQESYQVLLYALWGLIGSIVIAAVTYLILRK